MNAAETFTAQVAVTSDFINSKGNGPQVWYVKVTKTGRVNTTDNAKKATKFATAAAARDALEDRRAYEQSTYKNESSDITRRYSVVSSKPEVDLDRAWSKWM